MVTTYLITDMKKGAPKGLKRDKSVICTTSSNTSATTAIDMTSPTSHGKAAGSRSTAVTATGRLGRTLPGRLKLPRYTQTDRKVRDYLLSLPEQIENETENKPEVTPSQTKSNWPTTSNDTSQVQLANRYRSRRKSSCTGSHIPPPLTRDSSVSSSCYRPLRVHNRDRPYDPFKESSVYEDILERIREKAGTGVDRLSGDAASTEERDRDEQFIRDINDVQERINAVTAVPFFSTWTFSGFEHNKILLTSTTMDGESEKKSVSPEFLQYVKERDAARAEVKTALEELRDTQCRLYDAIHEIERLEKKLKGSTKKSNPPKKKVPAQTQNLKVSSGASVSSSGVSSARTSTVNSVRTGTDGVYHPPIEGIEPDVDTSEYYWKIGEMFPALPMFYILDAEKKFIKADLDFSGSIDKEELGRVLEDAGELLFTPSQVEVIFNEVDTNNSNYVDFYEVLVVLNKLYSRRKTNLPLSLQQNYSRTCSMQ